MINTIFIAIICVIVIDRTDFIDNIKIGLSKTLTAGKIRNSEYSLKPLDCSLCASFWLNLIYIIFSGLFSIKNMMLILLLSISTPLINDIIILLFAIIETLIKKIKNIFK